MPALALGVIVLILLLFAAYSFSKADPKQAVRVLRYIGGGAALLFAVFLLVRGAIGPALSIGLIGLGLLGYVPAAAKIVRNSGCELGFDKRDQMIDEVRQP